MVKSEQKNILLKFWDFIREDSWQSLTVFFILAALFIKFIFFPFLSFLTGSPLPLVIVESCSMYHPEGGLERTLENDVYERNGIDIEDTKNWDFRGGLNKGDVIFVIGPDNLEKGDVVIFSGGESHPIIHRLVKGHEPYATKGDNYLTNFKQLPSERMISESQLIGKAVFRVPYVGWIKLLFFEFFRDESDRGFC